MPTAPPTQVIVHRIELQKTERQYLEEYMEQRKISLWTTPISNAAGPIGIGLGIAGAGWLIIKGWAAVQQALLGPIEDASNAIGGVFAPKADDDPNRTTLNKVKDWSIIDFTDILQLFPEDSRLNQAGDVGEKASDWVWDTIFGLGSSKE